MQPSVDQAVRAAIWLFERNGVFVKEISLPHTEYAVAVYYIVATAEASSNLARYDGMRFGYRAGGKDLLETYMLSREEGFGPEVKRRIMLGTYALSAGYYDAYYLKAQRVRALIKQDFDEAFRRCDAIITPTAPSTAFKIGEKIEDRCKCTCRISTPSPSISPACRRCRCRAASMATACPSACKLSGSTSTRRPSCAWRMPTNRRRNGIEESRE
jgi:Asp-tRNA(Asn)/Glu-tRNA(Gln) amidotransferase A subunit family amidase